jgi:hypothetical protein
MTNPVCDGVSIDDRVPTEVELGAIGLSFTLGAGKNLSRNWQRELRTESESRIRASVSREKLEIGFNPPLLIDAQWPAMNMQIGGVTLDFATSRTMVSIGSIHGVTEGLIDFSEDAKKEIGALITSGIAGTAMAQPGYNPMKDPCIISTLELIADNFRRQPSSGPGEVKTSDFGDPRIDVRLTTTGDQTFVEEGAGLSVPKGTVIEVSITGRGNLATIMASETTADKVTAAKIESLTITSNGIAVVVKEKSVAFLDRMRIDRGGAVTLESMRLEGVLGEAAGLESLIRVIAAALDLKSSGGRTDEHSTIVANSLAKIVPGIVREKIEATLTSSVRQLVHANRSAIPEVDLGEILLA